MTRPPFTCPRCGAESWNPTDLQEGYCGRCHDWTGPPPRSPLVPLPLLSGGELRELLAAVLERMVRINAAPGSAARAESWLTLHALETAIREALLEVDRMQPPSP